MALTENSPSDVELGDSMVAKPLACSTEEAVLAFLEYLVDPVLPSRRQTPSESIQQTVAKQVHDVVLLYNYYHRKQNRLANHLVFVAFCKLAVVLRPNLMAHTRFMQRLDHSVLIDIEDQLSLVEKKIMDACCISMSLDAAKDTPLTNGWPISKVAVFLIDSRKENCFMQFCTITQGVWSVIETDVDAPSDTSGTAVEQKHQSKRKCILDEPLEFGMAADEVGFRKTAFSAVEAASGIGQSHVRIVESHETYCLSKERSAVRFYIMQCNEPKEDGAIQIPIKDVMDSLQGPLVQECLDQWIVTRTVEYLHVLPYSEILSDWLARGKPSNELQDHKASLTVLHLNDAETMGKPFESEIDNISKFLTENALSSENVIKSTKKAHNEMQCLNLHPNATDGPQNMEVDHSLTLPQNKDARKKVIGKSKFHSQQNVTGSLANGEINSSMHEAEVDTRPAPAVGVGASNGTTKRKKADRNSASVSSAVIGRHQNAGLDNYAVILRKSKQSSHSVTDKVQLGSPQKITNCTENTLKGIAECAKEVADHCGEDVAGSKTANYDTVSGIDNSINGHHVCNTCQSSFQEFNKLKHTIASREKVLSETALSVLFRKRDKLVLQQHNIEDEIAQCDRNIQMILHGGDDHLALMIDAVIEGSNDTCKKRCTQESSPVRDSGHRRIGCERLSMLVPNVQAHCQELDLLCCKGKWSVPSYRVDRIGNGFKAHLTVKGMDLESSIAGEIRASPGEARDSAAELMLRKLQGHLNSCSGVVTSLNCAL